LKHSYITRFSATGKVNLVGMENPNKIVHNVLNKKQTLLDLYSH